MSLIAHETRNGVDIVRFTADRTIDEAAATEFMDEIRNILEGRRGVRLVVDLTGLTMICTSAWGKLMQLHQELARVNGRLRICGLHERIIEVLTIMKLNKFFEISNTVDEAVEKLQD